MKTIKIDLAKLNVPSEIFGRIRNAGIETYNYAFIDDQDRVIKFGIQYSRKLPGERIYRQAWHIDGWPSDPMSGHGNEMVSIEKYYRKRYNTALTKNAVSIIVWDQTDPTLTAKEMRAKCEAFEKAQIVNYINIYGRAPVGNNEKSTKKLVTQFKTMGVLPDIFN